MRFDKDMKKGGNAMTESAISCRLSNMICHWQVFRLHPVAGK